MLEVVVEWWKTKGLTWERMVSGRHVKSRIDLIFYKGEKIIRKVRKLKLLLDHWAFFFFFFFKWRKPDPKVNFIAEEKSKITKVTSD